MVPRKCPACGVKFIARDFETPHIGCPEASSGGQQDAPEVSPAEQPVRRPRLPKE